tara:strand:- start:9535 stop:9834 length:300 start_codon:yes stop_codon:yes gene_type:complete
MEQINIEITNKFVCFKSTGKTFLRRDLRKINKYVSNSIGSETANTLIKFLQVWNEEEECTPVLPRGEDVSERASDTMVDRVKKPNVVRRKRGRRRRKTD